MKTQPISTVLISIVATLCLSGCYSLYYTPNAQNVPMLKEKNEARISAAYCNADDGSGFNPLEGIEIQSAYAAGKHFSVMVNGFKGASTEDADSYNAGTRNQKTNLIEFGAGYFKPFAENKFVFETYGGFGSGKFENRYIDDYDPSLDVISKVNFKRFFVQPSIGYSSTYFGAAFSIRASLLKYDRKPEIDFGTSYFLLEPCFTIRAGWKILKFQSQIQLSNNITNPDFPQHRINFNTGLYLSIPAKKSSK